MEIKDLFIHDATILKVLEDTQNDTLDWLLDYPVDWENNIFEKKVLRFTDLVSYEVDQFPFQGSPTILEYEIMDIYKSQTGITFNVTKFLTNAGERIVKYKSIELLDLDSI